MKLTKENVLCKLKGHIWYCNKRKDIRREDGLYSIAIEKICARCGIIKTINEFEMKRGVNNID